MDLSMDREAKLNTLLNLIGKIVYILDKKLERHEDDIDVDYPEKPMLFPDQTQTQPLQKLDNNKYIDDDQEFIKEGEQDYRENNKENLLVMMEKMVYILGKIFERYEANLKIDNLEQPMLLSNQEQTQKLLDMYDEQHYKESNEEGCQEIPDYLPIACTRLLRELHDQITNTNSE